MVVGHALHNDFRALKYVHPRSQTRDTTCVPSLLSQPGLHTRTRVSLKDLALQLLHKKIQVRGGERKGLASVAGAAAPPGPRPSSSPSSPGPPAGTHSLGGSLQAPSPVVCTLSPADLSQVCPHPGPGSVPTFAVYMEPSVRAARNSCSCYPSPSLLHLLVKPSEAVIFILL